MPQLDKTGPMGQGSQSGKKRGNCKNSPSDNAEFSTWKKGQGQGRGRGFRNQMRENVETTPEGNQKGGWGRGRRCRMQQNRNNQVL